jgi:hypothetical protein
VQPMAPAPAIRMRACWKDARAEEDTGIMR